MAAVIYDFVTGEVIKDDAEPIELKVKEYITADIDRAVQDMLKLTDSVTALKSFLMSIAMEMEKNPNIPKEEFVKGIKMFLSA